MLALNFVITIHLSEIYDSYEMTQQEIQEIKQAIAERGLQGNLKRMLEIQRPGISPDTIARAWKQTSYDEAPDACQLVLRTAKEVKRKDDDRIQAELKQFEDIALTA